MKILLMIKRKQLLFRQILFFCCLILLLWLGHRYLGGIFDVFAFPSCTPGMSGGNRSDGPRVLTEPILIVEDCTCIGRRVAHSPSGLEYIFMATGTTWGEDCIGIVSKRPHWMSGPILTFNIDPPTSSVTIFGEKNITGNWQSQIRIDEIGLAKSDDQSHKYWLNKVAIFYPYENRRTGPVFRENFPIHIEVTNPGYKPWSTDFVPQSDQIFVNVKLEKKNN